MNIQEMQQYALENHIPIIREKSGRFLAQLVSKYKPRRILEIGTAIGYSGILMLNAGEKNCTLTTIEKDNMRCEIAIKNFQENGFKRQTEVICADAIDVFEKLDKFDFIFLDGPKAQYINYLPFLIGLLKNGGVLVADNVFMKELSSNPMSKIKHKNLLEKVEKFVHEISNNSALKTTLYDIEDGLSVSEKKC